VHFGEEYRGDENGWQPSKTPVQQARSLAIAAGVGVLAWVFRQVRLFSGLQLPFSVEDHSPNNCLHASRGRRAGRPDRALIVVAPCLHRREPCRRC
jgi:hypothetical protein